MKRLFTFGCSFTYYCWPTWASVIAFDKGYNNDNFINYGIAGIGNVAIAQRILEADIKFNFTDEDEIMILWSSWSREDRIKNYNYNPFGSVYNGSGHYDLKWIKKWWDPVNDIVKNATAIIYVNKIYGNKITWQGSAFDSPFDEGIQLITKDTLEETIKNNYIDNLPKMTWQNVATKNAFDKIIDSHPDINGHVNIVENWIYKELGLTIKPETKEYFDKMHSHFKFANGTNTDLSKFIDQIHPLLKKYKNYYAGNRSFTDNWG